MQVLIFFISAVYVLGLIAFLPGLFRGLRRKPGMESATEHSPPAIDVPVTVLICARNEEKNLDRCLSSLAKIDYPRDLLEILVVDDRSTDSTAEKLVAWKKKLPNLTIISTGDFNDSTFEGKVRALIYGMDAARGEIVCITDADCTVSPGWVREHLKWYNADTGMVSSITILDSAKPFAAAQSLEMVELLSLAMATMNYDIPVSVIGNNLSIRKYAYQEIGGYRKIPFSVTEDVALFQAIWNSGKWKVHFKANADLLVKSLPPESFRMWWRQKHRWVIGGKEIKFMGRVILALGFIGAFTLIAAPFFLPLPLALFAIALKLLGDLVIILPSLGGLQQLKLVWFFIVYQLYLFFFLLCLPIFVLQKDVTWKGRIYHT